MKSLLVLLATLAGAGAAWASCVGLPDGTLCLDGEDAVCENEICISDYREETGNLKQQSPTKTQHHAGVWCRGKLVADPPLPLCLDGQGNRTDCVNDPTFLGLTLCVVDGGQTSYCYTWPPEDCGSTDGRYLRCTGVSKKATIKDRSDLGPGTFGFKLLPRGLSDAELPAPFHGPLACEFWYESERHVRHFRGVYDSEADGGNCRCETTAGSPTKRGKLVCKRCTDGPSH